MTDLQHQHVQRDLAALQAAEEKFKAAHAKVEEHVRKLDDLRSIAGDAERALGHARVRFRETAQLANQIVHPNGWSL